MKRNIWIGIFVAIVAVITFQTGAIAMPSYFTREPYDVATTTIAYMSFGKATTTATTLGLNGPNNVDERWLYVQATASTSAAVLDIQYQFSNNAIDWFDEDITPSTIDISQSVFLHASSTITHRWGAGSATASTTRKVFKLPNVPSNYARVVFSVPSGSTPLGIWYDLVSKRQAGQ